MSARADLDGHEVIWLGGKPRFLRETLAHVLRERFGARAVRDLVELEPPVPVPPRVPAWLIWFLNGHHELGAAVARITNPSAWLNLMLVQGDGQILIRRANGAEMLRSDLGLDELCAILKTTIE